MADDKKKDDKKKDPHTVKVNIDGKHTPILYTDTIYVTSNEYGVVLDVAQPVGPLHEQQVVTRIGMSIDHAKNMLKVIHEHLEKHER